MYFTYNRAFQALFCVLHRHCSFNQMSNWVGTVFIPFSCTRNLIKGNKMGEWTPRTQGSLKLRPWVLSESKRAPSNEEVNELECVDLTKTILTFWSLPFASFCALNGEFPLAKG